MNHGDGEDDLPLEIIDLEPARPDDHQRDRPPRRSADRGARRRNAPLVLAVVLVAGLAASVVVGHTRHHAKAAAASSTSDGRTVINLHGGGLFSFRVGARVLTGGDNGVRVVDTDTGSVGAPQIAGLPAGAVAIVAHSGATVAVRVGIQMYWFTLSEAVAHRVDADTAFAATQPGHVWLSSRHFATEVPGDPGRLPRTRVETDGPAMGATSAGLIVDTTSGYEIQPLSAATPARRFLPSADTVIAVHAERVAWVADCGPLRCPVYVTEIAHAQTSNWIQLPGNPSPLALAGTTGFFSPDGGRLAVVVPDNNITKATTMVVADLRALTTTVVPTTGYITAPARPGSTDAVGATIDWTPGGQYLVLAPALGTGDGRLSVIDPDDGRVVPGRVGLDLGNTAAAVATSSLGAIPQPHLGSDAVVAHPPAPAAQPGLHLVGASANQVDVLDLGTNQLRSTAVGALEPGGPHSIARVTGGWLVVRSVDAVVLIRDTGSTDARLVTFGAQAEVFSPNDGSIAWIAGKSFGAWAIQTYDAASGTLGSPVVVADAPLGATTAGLVVPTPEAGGTRLLLVDTAGRTHAGPLIRGAPGSITTRATGGIRVAYSDASSFHVIDVVTGASQVVVTGPASGVALSPDGASVAWIQGYGAGAYVLTARIGSGARPTVVEGPADRVLVANDGTIVFTKGSAVWEGRVGSLGARRWYGLAPAPSTALALG